MTPIGSAQEDRPIVIDGLVFMCDGSVEPLRAGGVDAVNVTVSGLTADFEQAFDDISDWLVRLNAPNSAWLQILSVEDFAKARSLGKVGLIMGWQNLRPIGDRINRLALAHRLGVRVMQLTYNEANLIGDGCLEARDAGLSAFGRKVVAELNTLGIAVDLSHVGERTTLDAIEVSDKPVLLTHANAKSVSGALRNKTDRVIKAVARTGGLIGLSVYGPMCWNGSPDRRPALEDFIRHLAHVVDLVGVEHVALGTDFPVVKDLSAVEHIIKMTLDRYPAAIATYAEAFGNDVRTRYLQDCSSPEQIPAIAEALQRRGWKHAEIDALLGQNYLRVLQSIWKSRLDGAP